MSRNEIAVFEARIYLQSCNKKNKQIFPGIKLDK